MKGAKAQVINAPFLQRDELLDDVNNLRRIQYPLYRWPVDHGIKIGKRRKGAKVQRYKGRRGRWRDGGLKGLLRRHADACPLAMTLV